MAGEHDGMDALGNEELRRIIELLTGRVRANSHDTQALSARGLAYEELGDHRRAAEDYGNVIRPGLPMIQAVTWTGPGPTAKWRSTAGR